MIARILSGFIILFWMTMTGLLVRKVWFPDESRLAEVSPRAVYELFAARGEPSYLDIFRDRNRIGTFQITPVFGTVDRPAVSRLNVQGRVHLGGMGDDGGRELQMRGAFAFTPDGEMTRSRLEIQLNRPRLRLRIDQSGENDGMVEFTHEDSVLFSSRLTAFAEGDGGNPYLHVLLAAAGISLQDLHAARNRAEAGTRFTARHGILTIEDRKFDGYVVSSAAPGEPGIRVYIDNAGQLLKMETPFGYSMLSRDVFRPDSVKDE